MRSRAIRGKKLYQLIFWGVIFSVAALVALAYWGVREIRQDAASVAVENSARGLSGAVTVLLNSVSSSYDDFGDGILTSLEPSALQGELERVFKEHHGVSAIVVSDQRGLIYMYVRRPHGTVEVVPDRENGVTTSWALYGEDGKRDDSFTGWNLDIGKVDEILTKEIRHLKMGQINWRSANPFLDSSEALITASFLTKGEQDNPVMLSFVFPVDAMLSQLSGAEKGAAEKIFLYWADGRAMPVNGLDADPGAAVVDTGAVQKGADLADPVIRDAVMQLAKVSSVGSDPVSFRLEGEIWWTYALPLTVFGDTMSLGVAVPGRKIVSTLTSDSFLQGSAAFLILLALGVLFILHRNRSRIEVMGLRREAISTEEELLALVAEGESGRLEFKQTLRFNLKAGKNGREIEHASLKTVAAYLNSEGGTLLVGVADDGSVTGFDEDKFKNGDHALLHLNNLINEHIGTEFSRYVDTMLIQTQGCQVLRVFCIPAPVPAILDMGKAEEFYVRSGPASRNLTLSQFYEWLKDH